MSASHTADRGPWAPRARILGFLYLSALLMVIASERIYWYWGGVTPDSILGLTLAYSLPAAAGLWALAITGGSRLHDVVLAGAVFGFVVEGVLTPVIYADGALPVFAAMFVGWHGMVAFVGAWFLVRRWLLAARLRLVATIAGAVGLVWGVWARAAAVGDTLEAEEVAELAAEGIDVAVLSPSEFATYALLVGAIFILGHWAVGYVWPQRWVPGKKSTRTVAVVAVGYMSLAVLPAVIWAPVKLAVLVGGTLLLMRKSGRTHEPPIIEQLHGRVPLHWALSLAPLPATAAFAYWLVSAAGLSDDGLIGFYWALVAAQVLGGALAYVWAARKALRPEPQTAAAEPLTR